MNTLEKWFPFMFKRKSKNEEVPIHRSDATNSPSSPALSHPQHQGLLERMLSDPALSQRNWFDPLTLFGHHDRFFGDFSPASFQPQIDVIDEGSVLKVSAELPGIDKENIELSIQEGSLILRGEKHREDESREKGCYRIERYFGQFSRVLPLPTEIDVEKAEARFDKGVLEVRLPKTAETVTRRSIPLK